MISNNININFKGETAKTTSLYPFPKIQGSLVPQNPDVYDNGVKSSSSGAKTVLSKVQDNIMCALFPKAFINKYSNISFIGQAIQNNPRITEILNANNVPVTIGEENIKSAVDTHFIPTSKYTKMIMKNSGETFTKHDYKVMKQASLLYDVGKILIPSEILNKKDKLTESEYNIKKLHEELGAEILRTSNLDPDVINLVGSHHNYKNQKQKTPLTQVLTVADVYSALKENRPYRPALSDKEAFEILEQGAKEGKYDMKYVDALKKSV